MVVLATAKHLGTHLASVILKVGQPGVQQQQLSDCPQLPNLTGHMERRGAIVRPGSHVGACSK